MRQGKSALFRIISFYCGYKVKYCTIATIDATQVHIFHASAERYIKLANIKSKTLSLITILIKITLWEPDHCYIMA